MNATMQSLFVLLILVLSLVVSCSPGSQVKTEYDIGMDNWDWTIDDQIEYPRHKFYYIYRKRENERYDPKGIVILNMTPERDSVCKTAMVATSSAVKETGLYSGEPQFDIPSIVAKSYDNGYYSVSGKMDVSSTLGGPVSIAFTVELRYQLGKWATTIPKLVRTQ